MKKLNACVKNELAVALFKSCSRFDADFTGHREPMSLWSGTLCGSLAITVVSCLQPLESDGRFPPINVEQSLVIGKKRKLRALESRGR